MAALATILTLVVAAPVPVGDAAENTEWVLVAAYPHDSGAFTQGLDFDRGRFFETTGTDPASLRRVELATGTVEQQIELSDEYFGEGMTVMGRKLWWITWQSRTAFVYNPTTFDLLDTFSYRGEGWGLTHNRRRLVMSNGSDRIDFRDPKTFKVRRRIFVSDGGEPVTRLNELEWVKGEIFANVWMTDLVARIDPATGDVLGWIDVTELKMAETSGNETNGIAYLTSEDRLFVTGKNWSHVYEIALTE